LKQIFRLFKSKEHQLNQVLKQLNI